MVSLLLTTSGILAISLILLARKLKKSNGKLQELEGFKEEYKDIMDKDKYLKTLQE